MAILNYLSNFFHFYQSDSFKIKFFPSPKEIAILIIIFFSREVEDGKFEKDKKNSKGQGISQPCPSIY